MNESGIIVEVRDASFSYNRGSICSVALDGLSLEIRRGEFLGIVGGNGVGKSTLGRLVNGILLPGSGEVLVNGIDTRDRARIWEVRSAVGMVFQEPENQIVGTTVEEDVAFGPENLGLPSQAVRERVSSALEAVGLAGYENRATCLLSGGERQKLALAGVLAMDPQLIILDEGTSMLDPRARETVMDILRRLNRERGITLLLMTGRMEEAVGADRIAVMDSGRILLEGAPEEVFSHAGFIGELGLELPPLAELFHLLKVDGFDLPDGIAAMDEAVKALAGAYHTGDRHVH